MMAPCTTCNVLLGCNRQTRSVSPAMKMLVTHSYHISFWFGGSTSALFKVLMATLEFTDLSYIVVLQNVYKPWMAGFLVTRVRNRSDIIKSEDDFVYVSWNKLIISCVPRTKTFFRNLLLLEVNAVVPWFSQHWGPFHNPKDSLLFSSYRMRALEVKGYLSLITRVGDLTRIQGIKKYKKSKPRIKKTKKLISK